MFNSGLLQLILFWFLGWWSLHQKFIGWSLLETFKVMKINKLIASTPSSSSSTSCRHCLKLPSVERSLCVLDEAWKTPDVDLYRNESWILNVKCCQRLLAHFFQSKTVIKFAAVTLRAFFWFDSVTFQADDEKNLHQKKTAIIKQAQNWNGIENIFVCRKNLLNFVASVVTS